MSAIGASASAASTTTITVGRHALEVEQDFHAEEGSVVWDSSRSLLAHLVLTSGTDADLVRDQRILEIGSGTGVVGLALAHLGAKSVVVSDKESQVPLMQRNIARNQPDLDAAGSRCIVQATPLCWNPEWQRDAPDLAQPDAFDLLVCCDCVYPDRPSDLASVLLDLLSLNPSAVLLLSCEHRPPPATAPPGTDHVRDFLDEMRRGCAVQRVADSELDPSWMCDEISLWRMRARSVEE